jgi:hypothetical protein
MGLIKNCPFETNPVMVTYTVHLTDHDAYISYTDNEPAFRKFLQSVKARSLPYRLRFTTQPSDPDREAMLYQRYGGG